MAQNAKKQAGARKATARKTSGGGNGLFVEIQRLVDATKSGQLSERARVEQFSGEEKVMLQGINDLIDAFVQPFNVTAEYIDRIGKGDIPEKITDEYKGDFNEIKNNLNLCIDAVSGLVTEAGMLTEASVQGRLETRADVGKFSGDYAKLVQGINSTIETLVGHIDAIPAPAMIIDSNFNIRFITVDGFIFNSFAAVFLPKMNWPGSK